MINDHRWSSRATGWAALIECLVFTTIVQFVIGLAGGPEHHPAMYVAGLVGLAGGTVIPPRGLARRGRPSFWAVAYRGAASRTGAGVTEFRRARAVVWGAVAYVAIGAALAATTPLEVLQGWYLAGSIAAIWWWVHVVRARRLLRRRGLVSTAANPSSAAR